jgi:hypothetical protein
VSALAFVYGGAWSFPTEQVLPLLALGRRLGMDALVDAAEDAARHALCHDFACTCAQCLRWLAPVAEAAESHLRPALLDDAVAALARHPPQVRARVRGYGHLSAWLRLSDSGSAAGGPCRCGQRPRWQVCRPRFWPPWAPRCAARS